MEHDLSAKIMKKAANNIDQKILDEIVSSIRQTNYGEVVITIHNSKVVQIEKRQKKRFQG